VIAQVRRLLFGSNGPPAELSIAPDEIVKCLGVAAITRGQFGGRWGPLILTNRRLTWYETGSTWPLKRQAREVDLRDILRIAEGCFLDAIFGGRRLRLRLRNGRTLKFFEGEGKLRWWIARLQSALD